MTVRRLHVLLLLVGLALAGPWACGGGKDTTTGSGGGGTMTVSTTHGVTAGAVGSTGSGSMSSVGLACTSDADCGGSLTCLTPDATDPVFGGGPAAGYCSASCTKDTDCPNDAACLMGKSGAGRCALVCTLGPALMFLNDDLSPDKCHGRNDVRCQAVDAAGDAACVPNCGEDSQCPSGRVCDPRLNVCVTTASTGKPNGSTCDPMATTPECAGTCLSFTGSTDTLCTQHCVIGGDANDPTNTPNCGGVTKGLCLFVPQINGMETGAGDSGLCAWACNTQDDCQLPGFWCRPIGGLTGMGGVNNGFCAGATACPNGAADCAVKKGDANTTCTNTKYGPFCLTSMFPLGNAAAGDAGPSDGGGTSDAGTAGGDAGAGNADAGDGG